MYNYNYDKPEINLINTTDINMDDLTPAMKHF